MLIDDKSYVPWETAKKGYPNGGIFWSQPIKARRRLPSELLAQGWMQNSAMQEYTTWFGRYRIRFCAIGAINYSGLSLGERDKITIALIDILYTHDVQGVVEWNDTPGRRKREVLRAMREAERLAGVS